MELPGEVAKAFPSAPKGNHNIFSPSGTILERGMWATTIMSLSLTIALGSYVSMCASDAREDEKFFEVVLLLQVDHHLRLLPVLCGLHLVLFHVVSRRHRPVSRYCDSKKGGSGSVGSRRKALPKPQLAVRIVEGCLTRGSTIPVDALTLLLNIMMPTIFIAIFLILLWMHRRN